MTHSATIGQQLGHKTGHGDLTHATIPEDKRAEAKAYDGDGQRWTILQFIKEHDGEKITGAMVSELMNDGNWSYHTRVLEKRKKITRVKDGTSYRYFLGKHNKPRENGEVVIVKPAAPVKRTQIEQLNREAWIYARQVVQTDNRYEISSVIKTLDGFLSHLEAQIKERTDEETVPTIEGQ